MRVLIQRTPEAQDLPLPAYATAGAAGMDLHAAVSETLCLAPGQRALVSTGIRLALPDGYEGQVRARSGLALQQGLAMVNAPGTVDSDYRDTIGVILINLGDEPILIQRGDRIAQLVVAPVARVEWEDVAEGSLPATDRGHGGFGSTGFGVRSERELNVDNPETLPGRDSSGLSREVYSLLAQANLLRMRGCWEEAVESCMAALRLTPDSHSAQSLLGDIYENQGRLDDAIQWYRMALDLNPTSTADRMKLERLLSHQSEGGQRSRFVSS